jgi:fibro-slime domain-containing protein
VLRLPVTYRDFQAAHSDFETITCDGLLTQMVQTTLGANGKPVLSLPVAGCVASVDSFAEWYTDGPGRTTIPSEIVLYRDSAGFVNRWGPNGEQWEAPPDGEFVAWCGMTGYDCLDPAAAAEPRCADPPAGTACFDRCSDAVPGITEACIAIPKTHYDGDPLFFPIDAYASAQGDALLPAKIPEVYGYLGYPWEYTVLGGDPVHNFHFTSELRITATYDSGRTPLFIFSGDDDVWVFLNGELILDLGGVHPPEQGSFYVDLSVASTYGLVAGSPFEIAIFHAERKTEGSTFSLRLDDFGLCD